MADRFKPARTMSGRIRVSGFRLPIVPPERDSSNRPVGVVRPVNLIGPFGAAWMLIAVAVWGTPHMLLTYRTTGDGAYRYFEDCAYAALDGRMAHRSGSACPLFRLMREGR